MAGYRQMHTKFWKKDWIMDLEPLERYLFIYLFTNEMSSISGIYHLPMKVICFETDLSKEFIEQTLAKFEALEKVMYRENTVWIVNMEKYHANASPKTQNKVHKDVDLIDDENPVKQAYLYYKETGEFCTDTVSIPYRYQSLKNKDKDKDKAKDKAKAEAKENEIENENSTPAADPSPPSVVPADPADRIYRQIKPGAMVIPPGNRETIIPVIHQALMKHGGDEAATVEEGKKYYQAYITRRGKDGAFYSPAGTGWVDWWAAGEIPPDKNNGHKPSNARQRGRKP